MRVEGDTVPAGVEFDHLVTQWMSTVTVSAASAMNSSHVDDTGPSTACDP
jgi:hypothetical protein